ncbi:MAG: CIA30 family protein [Cyanobium sp.]
MEPRTGTTLVSGDGFSGWHALNDTIMGGRSSGGCRIAADGLHFEGEVVEEGGGFISVRSPLFSPPLDLSAYGGLELRLEGEGRRFKLALACGDGVAGLTELIPGGLRWVHEFGTEASGISVVPIRFEALIPSVRARPISGLPLGLPLRFDAARVTRLQVLHSRFGDDGGPNPGFRAGPLHLRIVAIDAVP